MLNKSVFILKKFVSFCFISYNDNKDLFIYLILSGENSDWNDRRKSNGHAGIPLVSEKFIEEVPMLSLLFNDLGLKLDWLKKFEGGLEINTSSDISGIFFVPDAKNSKDSKNRKIIPMQDFVEAYNVCTVFGIGGRYMLIGNSVIAVIFFTKEKLSKDIAEQFEPLINCFKTATVGLVRQQKIFS